MPETEIKEVTRQDKKDALDAVVVDILSDELSVDVQEKLPEGVNAVVQAPGDKLVVKTGIVDEISKATPGAPGKSIAGVVGAASIVATVVKNIDKAKAENASTILRYIGEEFTRDGKLMQEGKFNIPGSDAEKIRKLSKGMKIAGKALVVAGRVCLTASKAAGFFSKFGK